jgi:hypothetical protein
MISLLLAMLFTSCSDVLIEDYIAGTWELKSYARNNMEETQEIHIASYEETYILGGTFQRNYLDGKQNQVDETGKFDINEDKQTIHLSDISSIADFSNDHSTLSTSTIKVVILDETEFVYSFENGGDKHAFRFIKKQ